MVSKILSYFLTFVVIFLIIGIAVQYYISQPKKPQSLICHKGKLLSQVGDEGTVYTRIKGLSCEFEKDILIIEEQSWVKKLQSILSIM